MTQQEKENLAALKNTLGNFLDPLHQRDYDAEDIANTFSMEGILTLLETSKVSDEQILKLLVQPTDWAEEYRYALLNIPGRFKSPLSITAHQQLITHLVRMAETALKTDTAHLFPLPEYVKAFKLIKGLLANLSGDNVLQLMPQYFSFFEKLYHNKKQSWLSLLLNTARDAYWAAFKLLKCDPIVLAKLFALPPDTIPETLVSNLCSETHKAWEVLEHLNAYCSFESVGAVIAALQTEQMQTMLTVSLSDHAAILNADALYRLLDNLQLSASMAEMKKSTVLSVLPVAKLERAFSTVNEDLVAWLHMIQAAYVLLQHPILQDGRGHLDPEAIPFVKLFQPQAEYLYALLLCEDNPYEFSQYFRHVTLVDKAGNKIQQPCDVSKLSEQAITDFRASLVENPDRYPALKMVLSVKVHASPKRGKPQKRGSFFKSETHLDRLINEFSVAKTPDSSAASTPYASPQ